MHKTCILERKYFQSLRMAKNPADMQKRANAIHAAELS